MFVLGSDIMIGNFRFSGVHEVHVSRSLHSITETATIKIPSIARIISNGKVVSGSIVTGKQFSDGDPVIIKLGYNGTMQTEFSGFVKHRNLDMPLVIECEGYSWLLRRNTTSAFYKSTTVKDLLNLAVSLIDTKYTIKVKCDVDIELSNVMINNLSGFDIINNISKYTDNSVTCFFIEPGTLRCGLVYTSYATGNDVLNIGSVSYQLGYNVVKDNQLRVINTENDPIQVKYSKKVSSGNNLVGSSDAFKDFKRIHSKILNHVSDASVLKQLANEKAYKINYSGYEGFINSFLQPYAIPGYKAYIVDDRYPERNGTYIIESTEIRFGINGARRMVEVGPKLGFANE